MKRIIAIIKNFFTLKSKCCNEKLTIINYLDIWLENPVYKCTKCNKEYIRL